jgi:hypothetical protein
VPPPDPTDDDPREVTVTSTRPEAAPSEEWVRAHGFRMVVDALCPRPPARCYVVCVLDPDGRVIETVGPFFTVGCADAYAQLEGLDGARIIPHRPLSADPLTRDRRNPPDGPF